MGSFSCEAKLTAQNKPSADTALPVRRAHPKSEVQLP